VGLGWALAAAYGALFLSGLAILYGTMLAVSSMAFWTVRTEDFMTFWYEVTEFARYPSGIYGPWVKALLTFGVPLLVVTNLPARVLAFGELSPRFLGAPLAGALMIALSSALFRAGLRRYQGAGG
jgi:ABC-2 type transport system permease protein